MRRQAPFVPEISVVRDQDSILLVRAGKRVPVVATSQPDPFRAGSSFQPQARRPSAMAGPRFSSNKNRGFLLRPTLQRSNLPVRRLDGMPCHCPAYQPLPLSAERSGLAPASGPSAPTRRRGVSACPQHRRVSCRSFPRSGFRPPSISTSGDHTSRLGPSLCLRQRHRSRAVGLAVQ